MTFRFVKPHFHYDSYTDFWKLVELSDFEWCWLEEIDLKRKCTYIISPVDSEWKPLNWWQRKRKNARVILWDLERPKPRGGLAADKHFLKKQRFDEIWVSDAQLAKDLDVRYIILGSDKRLGSKPSKHKKYDIVHMSYENGRRSRILEQLENVVPNGWGKYKDKVLRQSRFGLSIHQDNDLYLEPLRLSLFAAYGLPVISETVINEFPFHLLTSDYDNLLDYISDCLDRYKELKEFGKELKQTLCFDYQFRNVVKYAVEK